MRDDGASSVGWLLVGLGHEQRSFEKAAFDGSHGLLSLLLRPVVLLDSEDLLQVPGGSGRLVEPRRGRRPVLIGEVNLCNLSEPGKVEQMGITRRRCRPPRSGRSSPGPVQVAQAGSDMYDVKGHPATRSENPPARSQHGELRFQSTEDVGVGDGPKNPAAKGQPVTGGLHEAAPVRHTVLDCPSLGDAKTLFRLIGEHHPTP